MRKLEIVNDMETDEDARESKSMRIRTVLNDAN